MPKGLELSLGVDQFGRALKSSGTVQLEKLLFTALSACPSNNPFQDLGLKEDMIFKVSSPNTIAKIRLQIERIFRTFELENRARLSQSIKFDTTEEGELQANISYIDLEASKTEELIISLSAGGLARRIEK